MCDTCKVDYPLNRPVITLEDIAGVEEGECGSRQEFLTALLRGLDRMSNERWKKLPRDLKEWFNTAAGQYNCHRRLPELPSPTVVLTRVPTTEVITLESQGIVPGRDFI